MCVCARASVCGDVGKFNPLQRATAISSVAGILNGEGGDHFHFTRREIECFTRYFNLHFLHKLAAVSEYYNVLLPRYTHCDFSGGRVIFIRIAKASSPMAARRDAMRRDSAYIAQRETR